MNKYIATVIIVSLLGVASNVRSDPATCEPPSIHPDTHLPITAEYFQQFMDAEVEFTKIEITYFMGLSPYCENLRDHSLILESNCAYDDDYNWLNMNINDLEFFIGHYVDWDVTQHYCSAFPVDEVITPIFQIVQNDPTYYFSADEFSGEPSIEFVNPWDIGIEIKNHIQITIYPPDISFFAVPPLKSFIKGWDPCENPPEELQPLIDYLESVILPEMREHQYP